MKIEIMLAAVTLGTVSMAGSAAQAYQTIASPYEFIALRQNDTQSKQVQFTENFIPVLNEQRKQDIKAQPVPRPGKPSEAFVIGAPGPRCPCPN